MTTAPTTATERFPNLHVSGHPLIVHNLTELTDERTSSRAFRNLARQLTTLLIYEATAGLTLTETSYRTPMEATSGGRLAGRSRRGA